MTKTWEDTVMKGEQMSEEIQAKTKKWSICNPAFIEDICHITAEAQAKLTWDIAEKAGIQKVVDFIEKEFGYFIDERLCKIIIDDGGYYGQKGSIAKYQAFLKECEK